MLNSKRVNVRISKSSNDWLDKEAKEKALTKSALINLAIYKFINKVK